MSYTVLARRYRSVTFEQVIGQEAIAKTLLSAIAKGRVAHAYLFTGTRGVGKTTTARLFARALNAPDTIPGCPKPGFIASEDENKKGGKKPKKADAPAAFEYPPQDVQDRMAEAIMAGQDLNVVEIDGASNNGVEQARQLIANASLAPTNQALYKIYIIDEVHMLSTAAFNALLKTMEEPPAHVKFILCTTESHKVPATIQSRCQRFDFRNIPTAKIADHLRGVLKQEKVEAHDDVIWQIARLGNGSMRDALSLLDRLIATGETPLTSQVLEQMLGLPAPEMIVALVDAIAEGNIAQTLQRTSALIERGISEDQVVDVLIDRLRQLMLLSTCGEASELIELSDDARKSAVTQAAHFDAPGLVHMMMLCENFLRFARSSANPRALLDATMVRLALAEKMADVAALLSGGGGAGGAAGGPDSKKKALAGPEPKPMPGGTRTSGQAGAQGFEPRAGAASRPSQPHAAPPLSTSSPVARPASRWGAPATDETIGRGTPPPPVSRSSPVSPLGTREDAPPPHERSPFEDGAPAAPPVRSGLTPRSGSPQPPPVPSDGPLPLPGASLPPEAPAAPLPSNLNAAEVWAALLQSVGSKPSMRWIEALALVRLDDRAAHLSLLPGKRDMQRFVAGPRQREQLAELFRGVLGRPVRVEVDMGAAGSAGSANAGNFGAAAVAPGGPVRHGRGDREESLALPLVREVMETFDAVLIESRSAAAPPPAPVLPAPVVPPVVLGEATSAAGAPAFPDIAEIDPLEPDDSETDE